MYWFLEFFGCQLGLGCFEVVLTYHLEIINNGNRSRSSCRRAVGNTIYIMYAMATRDRLMYVETTGMFLAAMFPM